MKELYKREFYLNRIRGFYDDDVFNSIFEYKKWTDMNDDSLYFERGE